MLQVKDIHTYYGTSYIVQGLSLEVQARGDRLPDRQEWSWENDDG